MSLRSLSFGPEGAYPNYYDENGVSRPDPDPEAWQAIIERRTIDAVMFLRAVGAEHFLMHKLGRDKDTTRLVGQKSLDDVDAYVRGEVKVLPRGSHITRTMTRIALTDTYSPAVDVYLSERQLTPSDQPESSVKGIIDANVKHLDREFIAAGAYIVDNDPNFDSTLTIEDDVAAYRERVLSDPQYVRIPDSLPLPSEYGSPLNLDELA